MAVALDRYGIDKKSGEQVPGGKILRAHLFATLRALMKKREQEFASAHRGAKKETPSGFDKVSEYVKVAAIICGAALQFVLFDAPHYPGAYNQLTKLIWKHKSMDCTNDEPGKMLWTEVQSCDWCREEWESGYREALRKSGIANPPLPLSEELEKFVLPSAAAQLQRHRKLANSRLN